MSHKTRENCLSAIALILVVLAAYHNSFHGPFIFDDINAIVENPRVQRLWPLNFVTGSPEWSALGGRPVVAVSVAVNHALCGLNVTGYHVFNVGIHLLTALALCGLVRRTLLTDGLRERYEHVAPWLAACVAMIWGVHPLCTESVNYIVQRTESLMGLFMVLTLYCVVRSTQETHPGNWHVAAVLACVAGMGCKEVMVVTPLLVLFYDRAFLAGSFAQALQRRWDLYAGLAGAWLLLFALLASTDYASRMIVDVVPLSSWDYLKTQFGVIAHYLRLAIWPQPIVLDYYGWPVARSLVSVLPQAILVSGLVGLTLWACRFHPRIGFTGVWFLIVLAPTSSILPLPTEMAAERRMYAPLMGVVGFAVIAGHAALRRLPARILAGLAGTIVVVLAVLTVRRNADYRSDYSIWSDTVHKRPDNARARTSLGLILLREGQKDAGLAECAEAVRLDPGNAIAQNNLGLVLALRGQFDDAIVHYSEALRLDPNNAQAHNNLGAALASHGHVAEGIAHLSEAVRLKPNMLEARENLQAAMKLLTNGPARP